MDDFGRELVDDGGLPSVLGPVSVMEDVVDELLVVTKAVVAQLHNGSVGPGGAGSSFARSAIPTRRCSRFTRTHTKRGSQA